MPLITPKMLAGVQPFKEMLGMVGMLWDPHAIQNIYRIEDGLYESRVTCNMLEHIKQDPAVVTMIEQRYLRGEPYDMDALRGYPDGTLGRELVRHIEYYGFNPSYYQIRRDDGSELTYAINRVRETHDIWHVVLGFSPTPVGEAAQKAFELAQLRRPMAGVIVGGAILRYIVIEGTQFDELLDAVTAAYRLGASCKPLLAVKWEERLEETIDDLRAELEVYALTDRQYGKLDPKGVKPSRSDEAYQKAEAARRGQEFPSEERSESA